jgi:uncharacterized protein (TIGR03083 family)
MDITADQVIAVLRAGHDELVAFVAGVGSDGPTHGSGASEWTVAQVLSHLGSGAEITLAGLNVALTGEDGRGEGFNQSVWDRWNAKSPAEMAADFVGSNEALVSRYESIDAATRESLLIDLGFLPAPVPLAVAATMRLNEFALHSWDVHAGFDAAAVVAPEAVPLLLPRVSMMLGWVGHADELGGKTGSLAVHISNPESSFGVEIGEKLAITDDAPTDPDATLSAPAESWLRLVSGRLKPEYTPASVVVTGDLVSLDDLRRVFPGF